MEMLSWSVQMVSLKVEMLANEMLYMMDKLILDIVKAFANNATIEDIHDHLIDKGYSEEDIFLVIKAGQNLHKANVKQEAELNEGNRS